MYFVSTIYAVVRSEGGRICSDFNSLPGRIRN
jgi:hypothetical protein